MILNSETLWYNSIVCSHVTGADFSVPSGSTLNEVFNIPNKAFPKTPTINLLTIGSHLTTLPALPAIDHPATDISLHKHMAFHAVPAGTTLSVHEASIYRLKASETHNGVQYDVYYGLKIDIPTTTPNLFKFVKSGTSIQYTDFVPSDENLKAQPDQTLTELDKFNVQTYAGVSKTMQLSLDTAILRNISLAAGIVFNKDDMAIVELGICTSNDDGVEAYNTQIAFFVSYNIAPKTSADNNETIVKPIDIAGMQVLINK